VRQRRKEPVQGRGRIPFKRGGEGEKKIRPEGKKKERKLIKTPGLVARKKKGGSLEKKKQELRCILYKIKKGKETLFLN